MLKLLVVSALPGCLLLFVSLVLSSSDQHFLLPRIPYCEERLAKLPQNNPDLHILRDLFQSWLVHRRIQWDMQHLLGNMKDPPSDIAEQFAWKTSWNESYVENRINAAAAALTELEAKIEALVKELRSKDLIESTTSVQDLVHCTSGHLQPRIFPNQPVVSFMLQYFKRPRVIDHFVDMIKTCNSIIPSEFLINVDSPQEGQRWADLSWSTHGLIIPVMSHNVHELRGYNRLAGMARGKYMILVQDDDALQPADCSWLSPLVAQFDAMPLLAMVGLNRLQLSHGAGNDFQISQFMDPNTTNTMIFAFQVDLAPLAIRRSAFRMVGGLDEGLSDPGECGIWSDWELSIRFWVAGWHVAFMPLIKKANGDPGEVGGTHKPETGVRCWGRQQNVASSAYMARWGAGWGSGPGKFLESIENHVRLLNLNVLQGHYTKCPFRKGCSLVGDPPLPEEYLDYKHEDKPMVQA